MNSISKGTGSFPGIKDRLIVNADDLGMSPGANNAIFECFDAGKITDASIMSNADYFQEALDGLRKRGIGKIGVHLNLSYGKALNQGSSLHDKNGLLKNGFVSLLCKSFTDSNIRKEIEEEFEAQIERVKKNRLEITHLDSHRHIHMIPPIYSIVVRLAKKHGIERVRLINEDLFDSLKMQKSYHVFSNGGIIKYLLLKSFSDYNRSRTDCSGNAKFFSILYTGSITERAIEKIAQSGEFYEIMVHPGDPAMDESVDFYDITEKRYRTSPARKMELDALLSATWQ